MSFSNCTSATTIVYGEKSTLTSLPTNGFNGSGLTEFVVPSSVVYLESQAFFAVQNLTSISFAEGSKCKNIGSASFQLTRVGSGGIDTSIPKRRAHTPALHLRWMQGLSTSKGKLERPGHFINRDGFGITWSGSAKPQSFCLCSGVVWGLWGASGWFPNPRHWYFSCAATWNRTGPHPYSLFLLSCCLVTR